MATISIDGGVRVIFFGRLADYAGSEMAVHATGPISVGELRRQVADLRPDIGEALGSGRVRAAVGDRIVGDSHLVGPGDRVEFLPPVSGG